MAVKNNDFTTIFMLFYYNLQVSCFNLLIKMHIELFKNF